MKKTIFLTLLSLLSACTSTQPNNTSKYNTTLNNDELAEYILHKKEIFSQEEILSQSTSSVSPGAPQNSMIASPELKGNPVSVKLDTEKFPHGFRGDSAILPRLFNMLFKLSKKDEYESQKDYINKLKYEVDDKIYAFAVDSSNFSINNLNNVEYNADDQILSINVRMPLTTFTGLIKNESPFTSENFRRIEIISKHNSLQDYIGSNTFGNKILVSKSSVDVYGLAVVNRIEAGLTDKTVKIKLSPIEAKALGKNVGIAFICKRHPPKWPEPLAYQEFSHYKPTIDSPIDVINSYNLVVVDLFQIWIYDRKTGQIVQKEIVHQ